MILLVCCDCECINFSKPYFSVYLVELFTLRYRVGSNADGPLVSSSVRSFVEQLSARTSAPGGGSASACIASMVSTLFTCSLHNLSLDYPILFLMLLSMVHKLS